MAERSPDREISALLTVMAKLRDKTSGCPWDLEQTFETIAPYTIEEAYEVAGAIEDKDWPGLKEELGDLLFQAVYHARIAEEACLFTFSDVVETITAKMIARHPHIFADGRPVESAEAQTVAWEEHKRRERLGKSAQHRTLDGVPLALPALLRADKLQRRAASVGFDWDSAPKVVEKIAEEADEIVEARNSGAADAKLEEELGDLLFAVVNLARHLKIDPERALRGANAKFVRRFAAIEDALASAGRAPAEASLEEMEVLWQRAKHTER
ncbi:MAG: nucleoside triphosphate pyrophosphohydrolase [Alphaproteobacteria bacterium]|nr:nucleoside triphosphate pyrophosphohydrolase [Alphaproteobacteria bacterium]